MPSTPKKTTEVVKELFKSLSAKSQERIKNPQKNASSNALSNETLKLVKSFYENDSNSCVMPGKKEVLIVRDVNSPREKFRKRLLLDDISNLFNKFKEKYPECKLGKSKFFELRPKWVIPVQQQSQEVCKCFTMRILISYAHHSQTFHIQKC